MTNVPRWAVDGIEELAEALVEGGVRLVVIDSVWCEPNTQVFITNGFDPIEQARALGDIAKIPRGVMEELECSICVLLEKAKADVASGPVGHEGPQGPSGPAKGPRWWWRHEEVRARRFQRAPRRLGRGRPPRGKWSEPRGTLG